MKKKIAFNYMLSVRVDVNQALCPNIIGTNNSNKISHPEAIEANRCFIRMLIAIYRDWDAAKVTFVNFCNVFQLVTACLFVVCCHFFFKVYFIATLSPQLITPPPPPPPSSSSSSSSSSLAFDLVNLVFECIYIYIYMNLKLTNLLVYIRLFMNTRHKPLYLRLWIVSDIYIYIYIYVSVCVSLSQCKLLLLLHPFITKCSQTVSEWCYYSHSQTLQWLSLHSDNLCSVTNTVVKCKEKFFRVFWKLRPHSLAFIHWKKAKEKRTKEAKFI